MKINISLGFIFCILLSMEGITQTSYGSLDEIGISSSKFIGTGKRPTKMVLGANLAPISVGEYSMQIESYHTVRFGFNLAAGIAEPTKGTLIKRNEISSEYLGNGFFVKLGADYQFIKNNADKRNKNTFLEPYVGLRLVYAHITELKISATTSPISSFVELEDHTTSNAGVAISLGSAVNLTKSVSLKLGLQTGIDVLENRIYDYGYTPGMGLDWGSFKTQLIAALRFTILKGEKATTMTRRN